MFKLGLGVVKRILGIVLAALAMLALALAQLAKSAIDGEISVGDQDAFFDGVRRAVPMVKVAKRPTP